MVRQKFEVNAIRVTPTKNKEKYQILTEQTPMAGVLYFDKATLSGPPPEKITVTVEYEIPTS